MSFVEITKAIIAETCLSYKGKKGADFSVFTKKFIFRGAGKQLTVSYCYLCDQ